MEGMADFFSQSCVPNLPKGAPTKLKSMCVGDTYDGDYGALRCLTRANADVAFVSKNTFLNFFEGKKTIQSFLNFGLHFILQGLDFTESVDQKFIYNKEDMTSFYIKL